MLSTRPKFLYLTNKQLQTISKRLISSTSKTSVNSSKLLNLSKTFFRSLPKTEQQQYSKQGKNVALVSGIIIVGSYIAFNQSNYYSLDTLPSSPPSSQAVGGTSAITANATASSFAKPPKLLEDKKLFSTSTSSMHQENSISHQQHKEGIFLLNDEQVDTKLRQFEESYFINRGKGVMRYDICQLPSNSPIEDDRAEEIIQVPILQDNNIKTTTDWLFFGVFDGHGGWTTSSKLRDELINYVINELGTIYKPVQGEENLRYVPNSATIDQAIKNGFLKLDHEIVNKNIEKLLTDGNKAKAAELLMPALSGSCALLSFYDTNSKMLKVAVTGDSRAILGSFKDNHWTARQLSIDQTGSNPTEVARIISEHPDEPKVIRNGRVLGSLEPTRAFGDCRYKLPASIQERIYKQFFGKRLPNHLTSPPYVTAEPVITTTKINPDNNDFLVMASDGLYEMLTNEEIIGLVVKWMEREKMVKPQKSFWNFFGKVGENKLPEVEDITMDKASKKPIRKSTGGGSFLLQDNNVSTHLIRNALSNGGSKEQTSMIISIPNPVSRRYRDDLTVTVVFFGNNMNEANENGTLEINASATAGGADASKPKL
ncbi:Protein phosphatase 2C family protein [Candida parapsilosis]|uniref:PPM-type phosphatase domain-containing protein n=2 Tax=Candida parapsilosis TaxID=5480 RepID=G8BGF2_CANPC|nr:uncharacterized protein CPAR2_205790 [Candida parapsilosis]KAF6054914.1 Protein phosphatase 2C family protein [Candida parapsilosis]KAF6056062.1 Protein phosphatase 2C family protein [Candida parapsilosis]KAF6058993.1 Protein phosphatase 2C family protein [Candida parapsilosis]KAF6067750.1 Protein phosphatase 2C family protein [Candida parapsilosis]KAI5905415.1 Pyruvate dehydrogenase [Candida parapsilosis]